LLSVKAGPDPQRPGQSAAVAEAVPRARPQLPVEVIGGDQFVGREAELAALTAMLREARAAGTGIIPVIGGAAGVGKTALVMHWARQIAAEFPDGQLYVNLRGFDPSRAPMDPDEAVIGFLKVLGAVPARIPASPQARRALYRSLLAGRHMLLILDNAHDEEQVRSLLPGWPGCLAIVTSRSELGPLAVGHTRLLTLDVLAQTDARELLARALGTGRLAAEPAAVSELTRLCAGLPLALAIAAAQASARPRVTLAALAAELDDFARRPDGPQADHPAASARAVFSWTCQNLSEPAAEMFRLLGLHQGPDITAAAAASLAGLSLSRARALLAELAHCRLLTEHAPGRYGFHDLPRAYATQQAAGMPEPDRHNALARMLDHYLGTAHAAARRLNAAREPLALAAAQPGVTPEPVADYRQALAWFEAERLVLLSAVTCAAEAGFDVHAWQLPWAMTDFLDWRGDWIDWAAINHIALSAATRLGSLVGQAHASRLIAHNYGRIGDYDQARAGLTDCLALSQQAGDRGLEARVYLTMCWVYDRQRHYIDALGHAEHALALLRALGDRAGEAMALNNVGYCHLELGDRRRARTFCEQSVELHRENSNLHGEAISWGSLGEVEQQLGRHTQAAECYQRAIGLVRDLGDRYREAENLIFLGDNHYAAHDSRQARDAWRQALAILEDLRHPHADQARRRLRRQ
jgi:tetratricopeptide (TPR) repeat protein